MMLNTVPGQRFSKLSLESRITFLMPGLKIGGVEKTVINLIVGMLEQGYKNIDLVVASSHGEFSESIPDEVHLFNLDTPFCSSLRKSVGLILPLSRYLQYRKPDRIISNLYAYNVVAVAAGWLTCCSKRMVLVEHIPISLSYKNSRLLKFLMKHMYPWSYRVITVSKEMHLDFLENVKLAPNMVQTIYNPVIDTKNIADQSQQEITHPWFSKDKIPIVLSVGRLVGQKDFSTLIRAFSLVNQKMASRLVILGDGEQADQLLRLIRSLGLEDSVALLGFKPNPYAYMAQSDIFVLSSKSEALPTVLIEAMATGMQVVATNCETGPEEILQGGHYGELVEVGDVNGMAEAIIKVLSGNQKCVDPGWLSQFTVQVSTDKYVELLNS